MKKLAALLTLIMLASMALAGFAVAESEEQITLTFWTPTWRKGAEEGIINDFMAQHPNIVIETTYMSTDDIKANCKIAASSGTLPDMWYNWGGINSGYYIDNELCYDLTEYAEENNWSEKYLAAALDLCRGSDGHIYCLPQNLSAVMVWYRTDIFEECGLEVPTTFAALEAACDVLLENGYVPFATGGQTGFHISRYMEELLEYYCGAEEHDALLNLEADWSQSEGLVKAFEKLVEWAEKGYFQEGFMSEDPNNTKPYVFNGTCAMIMDNPGIVTDIVAGELDTADYAYFPFPSETGDSVGRVAAFGKMCQFNKDITPEKLEAAMLFWDYYYSEESMEIHTAIEQPVAVIGASIPEESKLVEGFADTINECGSFTVFDNIMQPELCDAFYAVTDSVLLGDLAPADAGAEMQASIDAYLAN